MHQADFIPELMKLLPGTVGAAVSVMFMNQETWPRRLSLAAAGAATARFGGEAFSAWTGLDASFSGFIIGLFSMAFVAGVFETWRSLNLSATVTEWIRHKLGLPPKPPGQE